MGPFVHASRDNPSRFSDGSYGVYYAGHQFETALREVAFHRGRFHARTRDPATRTTFKTITAGVDKVMHDIRKGSWAELLQRTPLTMLCRSRSARGCAKQAAAASSIPASAIPGASALAPSGQPCMTKPAEGKRIALQWDGSKIASWFDFETNAWADL